MKKPNIVHHNPFGGSPSEWVSYDDYKLLRIQYDIALEDLRFARRAATVNEFTTHDVLDDCANLLRGHLEGGLADKILKSKKIVANVPITGKRK